MYEGLTEEYFEEYLYDFLVLSVDLWIKYHHPGTLEKIGLDSGISEDETYVTLKIDGKEMLLNYERFDAVPEEDDREAQKGCYYIYEDVWYDFFRFLKMDAEKIEAIMRKIGSRLADHFGVEVEIDVD